MIIGSKAMKYYFSDFPREPKDLDVIKGMPARIIHNNTLRTEYLDNPVLAKHYSDKYGTDSPTYICKNELYTLKVSHSLWDLDNGSWEKHIWDIQFMKARGCKLIRKLFYDLYAYWETIHGKRKTSNLEMSAEDFFDNAIKYDIPHDDIHELLIKHPYFKGQSEPTYKKILKDGAEVDVCMDKFKKLTEKEKFNVTFEEVGVMMLENRYPKDLHWRKKYGRMLKKFILFHCKVEQGIWIIQNHKELLTNVPFNTEEFVDNLKNK